MRSCFRGAKSLDNYFARKDDSVDWLRWSDEVAKVMADYFKTFDTIVMGRRENPETPSKRQPATKRAA